MSKFVLTLNKLTYKQIDPSKLRPSIPNGLIHVNCQATPSYPKKSWGGGHFSFDVFCVEVCLRLQKNLGSRIFLCRNIVLKPFPCGWAFLHIFYIGIYWKTAKIAYFRDYEPLNVIFGANFIP